ncbi:MAG: sugar ABC transporter substrate-binding protein [Clostridiales bacterium]|nr:sugar ABC transporter substrate-binding protein [Clostridiales bacterium]
MKKLVSTLLCVLLVAGLLTGCTGAPAAADVKTEAADSSASAGSAENSTENAVEPAAPDDAAMQEKLNTTLYIGCSFETFDNPYLVTFDKGCQLFCKYLDSIGQKYEYTCMLNEGNSEKQINDINALLAKSGGNAIFFIDPNEAAIVSVLAEAVNDAGAFMCTTWTKPEDLDVWDYDGWVAHHSPDDVTMGYKSAIQMFESLPTPGQGKIVALQGNLGHTTANNRYLGLEKALKEYPGIELVAVESAKWMAPEALSIMETWLAKYDDIDGVWCANDNMAMGAIQALQAKGLAGKVKVCGINAIPTAIDYIEDGTMAATVDCNGWGQGGYSLAMCYLAWTGQTDVPSLPHDQRLFATESIFVNSSNVAEYKATYVDNEPTLDFEHPYEAFVYGPYVS